MRVIEIGQRYHSDVDHWDEAVQYSYGSGQHDLTLFVPSPTPMEVAAVHAGRIRIGVITRHGVVMLVYDIGGLTGDAPFSWHRLPADQQIVPDPLPDGMGITLPIILVDADTGIVLAIRVVTGHPHVSQRLVEAVRAQATGGWDPSAHDAAVNALHALSHAELERLAGMELAGAHDA